MPELAPAVAAPAASAAPLAQAGIQARARLHVKLALKMLETALPLLGAGSDDGKAVLTALKSLSSVAGSEAAGLSETEHMALGQSQGASPAPAPPGAAPSPPRPTGMPMPGPMPMRMGGGM